MKGKIRNYSLKDLWVVETSTGEAVAHRLRPSWQSPRGLECDGLRAVDGTPIDGHESWIEIIDGSLADVTYHRGALSVDCILCWQVEEDEFGPVRYDYAGGWGEPL